MWLALERVENDSAGLEQVLPGLEAVQQFAADLERRLAVAGVEGVAGVLDLHRRLREVLGGIQPGELERMIAAAEALARSFTELSLVLDAVRRVRTSIEG
jgi:hypothetical protein